MQQETCKNCGASDFIEKDNAYVCAYCDSRFPKKTTILEKEVHFNEIHGDKEESNIQKPKKKKNKWVALLLCIFGGYFGIHRFYEGKIWTGLLYLFTGGFFYIGWIVDTINLLFRQNPYYV